MSNDGTPLPGPNDELLQELLERALRGEPLEIEGLLARQPQLDERQRERLGALADALEERHPGARTEARAVQGERGPRLQESGLETFGHYKLLGELGRGAQGTVSLAQDLRLGRLVALKILSDPGPVARPGVAQSERTQRLRREAEITSKLEHPGICAVYETGIEGGRPFIAMRHVPGETLAARLVRARATGERLGPPRSPLGHAGDGGTSATSSERAELHWIADLVEELARTIHVAHLAQVVHRDLKPANVMITPEGRPVILDFGLARDEDSSLASLSLSGDMIGSPAYMAPEQVDPQRGTPDARTDVYALGVVLHECLTLERPFQAPTLLGLQTAILSAPTPDPRDKRPGLPRDLAVIVMTALEKDRSRRYQGALDLAEDLRRFREREPILARPAGPLLRLRRWTQRSPGLATGLVAAFVVLSFVAFRERAAANKSDADSLHARAIAALASDPARALQLEIQAAETGEIDRHSLDEQLLAELAALHEVQRVHAHSEYCTGFQASSDGRVIASAGTDLSVQLRDGSSFELLDRARSSFQLHAAVDMALSPDGHWVAFESDADAPRIVNTLDWSAREIAEAHPGQMLAFAPDSRRLARAIQDDVQLCWCDGSHPDVHIALPQHAENSSAAWSPDGQWLWITRTNGDVLLRIDEQGRVEATHLAAGPHISFQFAPDGRTAWFGRGGSLLRLDLAGDFAETPVDLGPDWGSNAIGFLTLARNTRRAVIGWAGGGANLVDLEHPGFARALDAGQGLVVGAEFSPDQSLILLKRGKKSPRVCEAATGRCVCTLESDDALVLCTWNGAVASAPIVSAHASGDLRRWSLGDVLGARNLQFDGRVPDAHGCDVAGRRLAIGDGTRIHVLDIASSRSVAECDTHHGDLHWVDLDPSGRRLAAACADGTVLVWELDSDAQPRELDCRLPGMQRNGVWSAEFSPDGSLLATAGENGRICVYEARDWTRKLDMNQGQRGLRCLRFDPSGQRLVSVSETEGMVRVWSVVEGREIASCRIGENSAAGNRAPVSACFDPTGRAVAISGWDGQLYVWNPDTGSKRTFDLGRSTGNRVRLNDLEYLPDGARIALATDASETLLVSALDGTILTSFRGVADGARSLDSSVADNLLVTQELESNRVRFWPLDPLLEARRWSTRLGARPIR